MEEQFNQSLELYKAEKIKLVEDLKNFKGQIEEKMKLFQNLKFLDEGIQFYTNKLNESKIRIIIFIYYLNIENQKLITQNKKNNDKIETKKKYKEDLKGDNTKDGNNNNNKSSDNEIVSEERLINKNILKTRKKKILTDSETDSYEIIKKGNKRKKIKKQKKNYEILELNENETKEIFENNNIKKISISKYVKTLKFKTKFLFTSESKNYIFYSCYKKINNCKGTAKINKNTKELIITNLCDTNIEHLKIDFTEFINLYETNNFKNLNFNDEYIQKLFILYMINKKNITDYNLINNKLVEISGAKLKLSKSQISKIKSKNNKEYIGLDLNQLLEKIKLTIPDLFVEITDFNYEIKIKNKDCKRSNRLYFFGLKKNLEIIETKNLDEIFLDITFKIIPPKFRPYKLLVIIGMSKVHKKPKIICLVLTKYSDHISYSKIFTYLNENHKFNAKIIHSDYEKAISVAIKENKIFNKNIIHSRCFFHFSQMIKNKLSKTGIFKKK